MDELLPVDVLTDLLASSPPLGPWIEDAACVGLSDAFLVDRPDPGDVIVLERVCRKCPVRRACGSYADASRSLGMWGGVFRSAAFYRRSAA